jgi:hypothetical protein
MPCPLPRRPLARWWLAWAAIIGAAVAQEKPAPLAREEAAVLALGAQELGAFGAAALRSGFPQRAKLAWFEVLAEYAPDDADARKALGFVRHGVAWQRDPEFALPPHDRLDVGAARAAEQRWQALANKLGAAHRDLAATLAAAGAAERARRHALRALRFLPTDAKAMALAGLRQLEGIVGDDVDLAVLRRSRRMDQALVALHERTFAVAPAATPLPWLETLGIAHQTVKSEHFTIHGDQPPDVLLQAAEHAERALAFCREAFAGMPEFPPTGQPSTTMVFLQRREDWARLVRQFGKLRDADFIVRNTSAVEIEGVETSTTADAALVHDQAVRYVAHDYSGLTCDALEEGIGHAIVGMYFGRNLVFTIAAELDRTVASPRDQARYTLPDLDVWKELTVELAWQRGGTATARLPLLSADEFPTDARIKAWSMCDYLLRRDPRLLRHLQAAGVDARGDDDVHTAFAKAAGTSLLEIEARWRRLWTEDSPLRRAIVDQTTPLETASKDAPAWLDTFNKLRQAARAQPVGWSAQRSVACRLHLDYLRSNKDQRGAAAEHTQRAGKPGFSNAGRTFAASALVWTKDAKKAAECWLSLPGYRDAILDPNLDTVGVHADGTLVVLAIDGGRDASTTVDTRFWPDGSVDGRHPTPLPGAVDVELLGPEVQRVLAANQRGQQKQVGYPLSFHVYHASDLRDVRVRVSCRGAPVPGILVPPAPGIRRTSARGMYVFWPFEPLPRGADVLVDWKWNRGDHRVTFAVQ